MKDSIFKIFLTLIGWVWGAIVFLLIPYQLFKILTKDLSFPDISIPKNFVIVCIIFIVLLIIIIKLFRKSSYLSYQLEEQDNKFQKEKYQLNKDVSELKVSHKKEINNIEKQFKKEISELQALHKKELKDKDLQLKQTVRDFNYQFVNLKMKHSVEIDSYAKKIDSLQDLFSSKTPFKYVSELKADFETCIYEDYENHLRYKPNKAISYAENIKEIRKERKKTILELNQIKYKYEFLIEVFPEIKTYLDDEQSLIHLSEFKNYEDFEDNHDAVRDWLSQEEYKSLSDSQKYQLALDRYKNRNKSNWEIGAEYELYIGYLLRIGTLIFGHEFEVDQYGVKERLNDLGRDIIAEEKDDFGNVTVYIIQCKRWAKDKLLHENVVCQLYGTALEYEFCHDKNIKVVPLLVTTAQLSDVAKMFAQRLGVDVIIEEMGEYPMIKCNIDSMIYHLPFDQQYYTTKIKKSKGEFYAWTVEEAESRGYRRAKKYIGS